MIVARVLELRDIRRSFKGGSPVLDGVSFSMGTEEVVALLGRNGSGKTTLIHIAMGMLFPHAGSARAFGLSPTDHPVEVKRRIGYVSEDQLLPSSSSISELIAFHRYLFPSWDDALAKRLLQRFGLEGVKSKVSEMSKGQARQLALLLAVSHRPELLILDEPASGLDPAARREFLETSIQLLNRDGTSILFSSHHMGDVERLGGRMLLLDEGKIRLDGALDELRENYCLAIIPHWELADVESLARLPGCLKVHRVYSDWHAVFRGAPENVQRYLHNTLGVANVRCATMPLEELFVEMVGDRHEPATA